MAQRTWASSSFSVKYQWPDAGRDRFESSPVIHSDGEAVFEEAARLAVQAG